MREPLTTFPEASRRELATTTPVKGRSVPGRFNPAGLVAMTFLLVCTIYFLTPFFWLVVTATKSPRDLQTTFGLWFGPRIDLIANLQRIFTIEDGIFVRWLFNTLLYAGGGALIGTLLASMTGYALAKFTFAGRTFIFALILGAVLVPATTLALPLFLMMSSVNMTNTYWSVLLPGIVSPFGVYLSRIYATAAVPNELLEAARVDGAGEFRIFSTIASRLMGPALATIFLFQLVAIWNNYFLPLIMLNNAKLFPLTVGLQNWGSPVLVVPGALVSMIPLLVGCALLQRYWRIGLGTGSVKG
jgi:multiple sugar transport system permease protein